MLDTCSELSGYYIAIGRRSVLCNVLNGARTTLIKSQKTSCVMAELARLHVNNVHDAIIFSSMLRRVRVKVHTRVKEYEKSKEGQEVVVEDVEIKDKQIKLQ